MQQLYGKDPTLHRVKYRTVKADCPTGILRDTPPRIKPIDSLNLETIVGICIGSEIVRIAVLFGSRLIYLLNRRNRRVRQAAQSWSSTTGRVLDARVMPRVYFQQGSQKQKPGLASKN